MVGAVNEQDLKTLLSVLRDNGVAKYSSEGVAIEFHERAYLSKPVQDNSTQPEETSKPDEKKHDPDEDLFYSSRFGGTGAKK